MAYKVQQKISNICHFELSIKSKICIVILSISEISTEFKTRFLNLWILRFLAKAQYDNFIDMAKFMLLFKI